MAVLKYKNAEGEFVALSNFLVQPITPVQTTGESTTDIMSQKAVTDALNTKANTSDVYTKTEVDETFLTQENAETNYLTKTEASTTYLTENSEAITNITNAVTNIEEKIPGITGETAVTIITEENVNNYIETSQTIQNIQTGITEIKGDITTIEGDITTIEGDITNIMNGTGLGEDGAYTPDSTNEIISAATNITEAINNIANAVKNIDVAEVVTALPDSNQDSDKIYILANTGETGTNNTYVEYLWVNGQWEKIGEFQTSIDLSGYVETTALTQTLASYVQSTALTQTLGDYVTNESLSTTLGDYVTEANFTTSVTEVLTANNYVDETALTEQLANYATTASLANYATTASVSSAISEATYNTGSNTATSISNVPTTKRLCIVTLSGNGSFSLSGNTLPNGREIDIVIRNTSASNITISMPSGNNYVQMSGDSLSIAGNGYGEINVISNGTNKYIRFV